LLRKRSSIDNIDTVFIESKLCNFTTKP